MHDLRAVVFDLDGTLVDSAPDIRRAVNRMLAEQGRRALALDEVVGMIGDGAAKLVARAFAATGDAQTGESPAMTRRFLELYEGNTAEDSRVYPNVPETLERLRAYGLALGVCSNKPEAPSRELLRDLGLDHHFAAVLGGDSLYGIRKPDPRHLLAVLDILGAGPEAAVMVGDNANDVDVARAAGVPVIVRAGGYTRVPTPDLGADAIIDDFVELPEVIARLAEARGGQ